MIINCIPHKDKEPPRITLLLSNSQDTTQSGSSTGGSTGAGDANKDKTGGLTVRIKAEGFRLAGDKGMNVPRIKLASINVTAVLRVAVTMVFNTHTKKWFSTAKQFRVELLSFKGDL